MWPGELWEKQTYRRLSIVRLIVQSLIGPAPCVADSMRLVVILLVEVRAVQQAKHSSRAESCSSEVECCGRDCYAHLVRGRWILNSFGLIYCFLFLRIQLRLLVAGIDRQYQTQTSVFRSSGRLDWCDDCDGGFLPDWESQVQVCFSRSCGCYQAYGICSSQQYEI